MKRMLQLKVCMAVLVALTMVIGVVACDAKPPAKETAPASASGETKSGQPSAKVFTLEDYQRDLAILQIKLDGVKAAKEAVAQQEVNLSVIIEQYKAKVNEMAQAKAKQGKQD